MGVQPHFSGVATWSMAMIALFQYKRRTDPYLQMGERFRMKRTELGGAKFQVTVTNVTSSCKRLLLAEFFEWSDTRAKRR